MINYYTVIPNNRVRKPVYRVDRPQLDWTKMTDEQIDQAIHHISDEQPNYTATGIFDARLNMN